VAKKNKPLDKVKAGFARKYLCSCGGTLRWYSVTYMEGISPRGDIKNFLENFKNQILNRNNPKKEDEDKCSICINKTISLFCSKCKFEYCKDCVKKSKVLENNKETATKYLCSCMWRQKN